MFIALIIVNEMLGHVLSIALGVVLFFVFGIPILVLLLKKLLIVINALFNPDN